MSFGLICPKRSRTPCVAAVLWLAATIFYSFSSTSSFPPTTILFSIRNSSFSPNIYLLHHHSSSLIILSSIPSQSIPPPPSIHPSSTTNSDSKLWRSATPDGSDRGSRQHGFNSFNGVWEVACESSGGVVRVVVVWCGSGWLCGFELDTSGVVWSWMMMVMWCGIERWWHGGVHFLKRLLTKSISTNHSTATNHQPHHTVSSTTHPFTQPPPPHLPTTRSPTPIPRAFRAAAYLETLWCNSANVRLRISLHPSTVGVRRLSAQAVLM